MSKKKPAKKKSPRKGKGAAERHTLDLTNLPRQAARDILNDELMMRTIASLEGVEPGKLITAVMAKFPDVPVNKMLFRYTRKKR